MGALVALLGGRIPWAAIGVVGGVLVLGGLWLRGSYYSHKYDAEVVLAATAVDINHANAVIARDKEMQVKAADAVALGAQNDMQAVKIKIAAIKRKAAHAPQSDCVLSPELLGVISLLPDPDDADKGSAAKPAVHPAKFTGMRGAAAQAAADRQ